MITLVPIDVTESIVQLAPIYNLFTKILLKNFKQYKDPTHIIDESIFFDSISSCPLANKLGLLNKAKIPKKEVEIKEEIEDDDTSRGSPSPTSSGEF